MPIKFEVVVRQKVHKSYFDSEKDKAVEYDRDEEIRGTFYDWNRLNEFVDTIISCFSESMVDIKVVGIVKE